MSGALRGTRTLKVAGLVAVMALIAVLMQPVAARAASRCAPVSQVTMKIGVASGPIVVTVSGSSCQTALQLLRTYNYDHSQTGCKNSTCDVSVSGWSCMMPTPKQTWLTEVISSCARSSDEITERGQWTRCPGFTQTHSIGGPSAYYGMQTWKVSCNKMKALVWGSFWGKPLTSSGSTLDGVLWHGWEMYIGQEQAHGTHGGASFSGYFNGQGQTPLPWATLLGPG